MRLNFDLVSQFVYGRKRIPWTSHVFLARKVGGELEPQDTKEIREVKLVTIEELQNEIKARMLKSGSGGLRYRAYLADIFLRNCADWDCFRI